MNYINRITFDKLKAQFEILKMRSAYIAAEKLLIQEAADGNDLTGIKVITEFDPMTPEEFHEYQVDGFGNIRHKSPKEVILDKMNKIAEQAQKYLEQEKYELVQELRELYDKYKSEYDRL
jgi:hypothetical protein